MTGMTRSSVHDESDSDGARGSRQRAARTITAALMISFAVLALAGGHARWELARAHRRLAVVTEHARTVREAVSMAYDLRGRLERVETALARRGGDDATVDMTTVLASVVDAMPAAVTLDGIECVVDPRPGAMLRAELIGQAAGESSIQAFARDLALSPTFGDIHLAYPDRGRAAGAALVPFRLSFRVDPMDPASVPNGALPLAWKEPDHAR